MLTLDTSGPYWTVSLNQGQCTKIAIQTLTYKFDWWGTHSTSLESINISLNERTAAYYKYKNAHYKFRSSKEIQELYYFLDFLIRMIWGSQDSYPVKYVSTYLYLCVSPVEGVLFQYLKSWPTRGTLYCTTQGPLKVRHPLDAHCSLWVGKHAPHAEKGKTRHHRCTAHSCFRDGATQTFHNISNSKDS
jgi:hypothetical protein